MFREVITAIQLFAPRLTSTRYTKGANGSSIGSAQQYHGSLNRGIGLLASA